jgi:TatD DNase family protein
MRDNEVIQALCISVTLENWPRVRDLAHGHAHLHATVGVHPDEQGGEEPDVDRLAMLAATDKVVAIGETGLDYYRQSGDTAWQRERFRTHIRAARAVAKPLVIHTRAAAEDTLRIMSEERAGEVGGVMHCFTESRDVAEAAMQMGFHISFSGIVTFKNALELKEVCRLVPLERMLIETDSPYLAPVPFRGKRNEPAFVRHVAAHVAELKGVPFQTVADATSRNFSRLFAVPL